MKILKDKEVRNAIGLGSLCTVSYLGCYFARNILSVVAPQMTAVSTEYIGIMSTAFMVLYAAGQLINGRVGDIIKTKYMVSIGIFLAGVCNILIGIMDFSVMSALLYGISGLFLSMIYAPIMKVVSENTIPVYAQRCSLGFVVASFLGTPLASLTAVFFNWKSVFVICGSTLIIVGILAYIVFSLFEKKGIVKYNHIKTRESKRFDLKVLIENSIIKFTFISILTGIVRTSVMFWIPTYLVDYLEFSPQAAAGIFTVVTLIKSASPYFNILILYERVLKRNMNKMLILCFALSMISFVMMFAVRNPQINIVFLMIALLTSAGASTMMFSVYCPGLRDTGMVSTATGYLDCVSYIGAALANLLFANAISAIGWGNLILVWAGLMLAGVVVNMPVKKMKK